MRIVLGSDTTFRILSLKTSKKKKKVGDDLSQIENLRTIDVFAQPAQCADGRRIHYPLKMDWVTKGRVILLEFNPAKSPYKNLKVEPIFDVVNGDSYMRLFLHLMLLSHLICDVPLSCFSACYGCY